MAYITGKSLDRKIKIFGLQDIEAKITAVMNNEDTWPGPILISPASPDDLDTLRITLYSLIHKYGLKEEYSIRTRASYHTLILDKSMPERKDVSIKIASNPDHGIMSDDEQQAESDAINNIFKTEGRTNGKDSSRS